MEVVRCRARFPNARISITSRPRPSRCCASPGRRRRGAAPLRHPARVRQAAASGWPRGRSRAARRPVGDRPRVRLRVVECPARRGRSASAHVRRRESTSSSGARPAARRDAPSACSRCIRASPRHRCTRRSCSATPPRCARVCRRIRELATQPGGPHDWEPLLYACHTCMCGRDRARLDGLVAIARQLCALGANPNAEYHWNWHPELPRTALWGALCARVAPAACRGPARGRCESDRRRVGAHRRWRRRRRGPRAAAPLRPATSTASPAACRRSCT